MRRTWSLLAILALVGVCCSAQLAHAQLSPGPLANSHSELEGVKNCRTCHGKNSGSAMDAKCMKCHGAIEWLRDNGHGLHAREGNAGCAGCHPDHAGKEFSLIEWEGPDGFDHTRTGYDLIGKHAQVKCEECHKSERVSRALLLRRPEGSGPPKWVGMPSRCSTCHNVLHSERLSTDCANCHSPEEWKKTQEFDHGLTGYRLTGKHRELDCVKCHENGKFGTTADRASHLAPIPTNECSACHADTHKGRFGPDCSKCHVTDGFKIVSKSNFNHDRTEYPLRGAHLKVECDKCHDPANGPNFGPKPKFAQCSDCHTDPHKGQATLAGVIVDCKSCHAVDAFVPSLFTVTQHAESKYALEGKHASVKCEQCHRTEVEGERGGFEFRTAHETCRNCHDAAHGAQFVSRASVPDCAACHDFNGFKPSTYTPARHQETKFPLAGAHAKAKCERCHSPERTGLRPLDAAIDRGTAKIALTLSERGCEDCHGDPHESRYATGKRQQSCESCHTPRSFRPSKVGIREHDTYAMKLEGGHRTTPCFLCHKALIETSRLEAGQSLLIGDAPLDPPVLFWPLPTACEDCHGGKVPR